MPIPPPIFAAIVQLVIRLAPIAYRVGRLVKRTEIIKIGKEYSVSIVRRLVLGADGGISQMVEIMKKGNVQEIWHMVVRSGRIIHKDRKL